VEVGLSFFYLFAVLAVAGAVGVVVSRQPVHSALALLISLLSVAGLFVLANAEFLFAVQMLVYAGGIMVLFLFTIMLVNVKRTGKEPYVHRQAGLAIVIGLLLFVAVGGVVIGEARAVVMAEKSVPADPALLATTTIARTRTRTVEGKKVKTEETEDVAGNSQAVAWRLYRDYLLPFEVASVFLLVAMIGAVVLGKRTMEKVD
jgi:NADH-quinone oxidoreductase subunit J